RTVHRMNDWKRLVKAIATDDVKQVHYLIRIALKQHCGPNEILERFFKAVEHVYHARGHSEADVQFAKLIQYYAGRNGLFAANKHLGIPSSSALYRLSKTPCIWPSPGKPTSAERIHNIHNYFPSGQQGSPRQRCGHILAGDGLAVDPRMRWFKTRNIIIGGCREHFGDLDATMSCWDSVLKFVHALLGDSPQCHFGSEATVFGIAPLRDENYHILPISLSASCKAEKATEFGDILISTLDDWAACAAEDWGDIWAFSCDGASTFRGACYEHLMSHEFDKASLLYRKLSVLRGLNLRCGKRHIIHAPDPKHLLKRVATHLRSAEGSLVDGIVINRAVLARFLQMLPGQTKSGIENLIDPADHQNVPRAVNLLRAVVQLSKSRPPSLSPTDENTYHAICLQATLWESLLVAFVDQHPSLSEQLKHLATFAHIAFALYLHHGSAFMSNQLYSDLQALVKACFTCVAQQQLLD
ncbi:hypothetical protein FOMPIDRAFT_28660, partial [Fomitopsis schrenkii]